MQKTISIIVPVYNEEGNIIPFFDCITEVTNKIPNYKFEYLFINDGSTDKTLDIINELSVKNNLVKIIDFSRNFGKEAATSAGLKESSGDGVIMIDADLDQPPNLIPEFIKKWEEGFEVVMGLKKKSPEKQILKTFGSKVFYWIMNGISNTPNMSRSTDFTFLDRKVVNSFNEISERNRITRGIILWLGYKQTFIDFNGNARFSGKSNYSYLKLIKLALNSFISHSLFPLKIAGYLGLIITIISGFIGLFSFIGQYYFRDLMPVYLSGSAFLALFITFLVGIILICLGFIALYIGSIHDEVSGRPLYVIRKKNF